MRPSDGTLIDLNPTMKASSKKDAIRNSTDIWYFNINARNLNNLNTHRESYTIFELFYMIRFNILESFPQCKMPVCYNYDNYPLLLATKLLKMVTTLNTYLLVERFEDLRSVIMKNSMFLSMEVIEVLSSNDLMTEFCGRVLSTFAGSIYKKHFRIESDEFTNSIEKLMESVVDLTFSK